MACRVLYFYSLLSDKSFQEQKQSQRDSIVCSRVLARRDNARNGVRCGVNLTDSLFLINLVIIIKESFYYTPIIPCITTSWLLTLVFNRLPLGNIRNQGLLVKFQDESFVSH